MGLFGGGAEGHSVAYVIVQTQVWFSAAAGVGVIGQQSLASFC